MSGVAKEYLVRMDADPFRTQPSRDETSNGRSEHGDDNQVDTGTNLECAGRYARIFSRGYRREAHASTECEENESQSGSSNCTRYDRCPWYRRAFVDRAGKLNCFKCFYSHEC